MRIGIIHLRFKDCLLLFCRGDEKSVNALNKQFQKFLIFSGLKENLQRREVYFCGVPIPIQQQILDVLGYSKRELLFWYLGDPLSTKRLTTI